MNIQTEFELNRTEQLEIGLVESANAFKWLITLVFSIFSVIHEMHHEQNIYKMVCTHSKEL